MFKKILIANRGDSRSEAQAAAQARVGRAKVMPEPSRLASEARGDAAAETTCSRRS
jgi:hypothetical protein